MVTLKILGQSGLFQALILEMLGNSEKVLMSLKNLLLQKIFIYLFIYFWLPQVAPFPTTSENMDNETHNFPTQTPACDTHSPVLLDLFHSFDP